MTNFDSPAGTGVDPDPAWRVPVSSAADAAAMAEAAVASLRKLADQLRATANAERTVTTTSNHTLVGAGGRLRSVSLDRAVLDQIGHGVDPGALGRDLLSGARDALVPTLSLGAGQPPAAGSVPGVDAQLLREFGTREFTGQSPDGLITATALGSGDLSDLTISATAVRGDALAGVGAGVVAAVNQALDEVQRGRRQAFHTGDLQEALQAKADEFQKQLAKTQAQLDSAGASLSSRRAEVDALLAQRGLA